MSERELTLPAYARLIGIDVSSWEDGLPVLAVDFTQRVCGNPGTYHGGALAGLLELAAFAALRASLDDERASLAPLSSTVEYLRSAVEQRTFATGRVVRAGRRLANVSASAWQGSPDRLVAAAIFNVAITAP